MKKIFLILFLLFLSNGVDASPPTPIAYANGVVTVTASPSTPLPVTISGGISSGVNLGTSASATNPQRTGDVTTGLFSAATGTVALSCSNQEIARATTTGWGIFQQTPISALDVSGGATIGTGYSGLYPSPANGVISQGSVGIGTTSPAFNLDVQQASPIQARFMSTGSNSGGISIDNPGGQNSIIFLRAGGASEWEIGGSASRSFWFNENSGAIDINVTTADVITIGTTSPPALTVLANGTVGLGTSTPRNSSQFDVNGILNVQQNILMQSGTTGAIMCLTSSHQLGHCTAAASCLNTCTCTCAVN